MLSNQNTQTSVFSSSHAGYVRRVLFDWKESEEICFSKTLRDLSAKNIKLFIGVSDFQRVQYFYVSVCSKCQVVIMAVFPDLSYIGRCRLGPRLDHRRPLDGQLQARRVRHIAQDDALLRRVSLGPLRGVQGLWVQVVRIWFDFYSLKYFGRTCVPFSGASPPASTTTSTRTTPRESRFLRSGTTPAGSPWSHSTSRSTLYSQRASC